MKNAIRGPLYFTTLCGNHFATFSSTLLNEPCSPKLHPYPGHTAHRSPFVGRLWVVRRVTQPQQNAPSTSRTIKHDGGAWLQAQVVGTSAGLGSWQETSPHRPRPHEVQHYWLAFLHCGPNNARNISDGTSSRVCSGALFLDAVASFQLV